MEKEIDLHSTKHFNTLSNTCEKNNKHVLRTEELRRQRSLTACWIEKTPSTGREYCHTCFEMADGSTIVFFDWVDQRDRLAMEVPNSPGHLAIACDEETQNAIKGRLEKANYDLWLTDHGYCLSLYVTDPNNLRIEFAVDKPNAAATIADQRANAHAYLKQWVVGDHVVSNDLRLR